MLRNLSNPRALIVRGWEQKRIPGRKGVTCDIVVISEGDRVPAGGLLLTASAVIVYESLLTGELVSARKVRFTGGESG